MSQLWPRMNSPMARALWEQTAGRSVRELAASSSAAHRQVTYAATGGTRAQPAEVRVLTAELRDAAAVYAYPEPGGDAERIAFDRAAAEIVFASMPISTVEAAQRGVWNFLAVVAMPDLTFWRFGRTNIERWVASDLTRHMFSRLWWQALTFAVPRDGGGMDFSLLRQLGESDLNQITERRAVGGNPRLARALARAVGSGSPNFSQRELLRSITPRLRRRLAFIDFSVLSDEQLDDHLRGLIYDVTEDRVL